MIFITNAALYFGELLEGKCQLGVNWILILIFSKLDLILIRAPFTQILFSRIKIDLEYSFKLKRKNFKCEGFPPSTRSCGRTGAFLGILTDRDLNVIL